MMTLKQYKINNSWGINCITYENGTMGLEVMMLQVPWLEVVESVSGIADKNTANKLFKELVEKYRCIGEIGYYRR